MTAQLPIAAIAAWAGWVWLTPIPPAFLLSQLPLAILIAGLLLADPPATARLIRPITAQLTRPRPAAVAVIRPADVPTLAAWRAREALAPERQAA
jgi:hypothetical protein